MSIISLMAATMLAGAALESVDDNAVLCLEHAGGDESMWVALGEKYRSGSRRVRQIELEPGKKSCIRYDGLRSVTVNHYYLSEAERRADERDRIDPFRVQACEKVLKNGAAFYRLGSDDAGEMTCEADSARDDSSIRELAAAAKPFRG
jgi:hypothetical protein